ncbi:hypothetical protein FJZ53_03040 [Candidatus Woesearchaeota archaeon]|nr:hypothetical protein [Candidatus Woesearchaeota archaeon]
MNKKGQVYIIAALIMALAIYSLSVVYNFAKVYEFKGDFEKITGNYEVESAKLINSIVSTNGDVTESFTNFTTLFMSYSKSQNPNFGIIYTLSYDNKVRVGNYLKKPIKIDDGKSIVSLDGCFEKVPSILILRGIDINLNAAELGELRTCFTNLPLTERIWVGIVDTTDGREEVIWYPFKIEENKAQLMIINLMEEGPQKRVTVGGEGYLRGEYREDSSVGYT